MTGYHNARSQPRPTLPSSTADPSLFDGELASADLPGAAIGTPMTYMVDGKQYIALTVNAAAQNDVPELIAMTLP